MSDDPSNQPGTRVAGPSYGRRFVLFQLSKYVWGLELVALLLLLAACVRGSWLQIGGAALASVSIGYAAFRMTNQYRCPHPGCGVLLAFAHGTSAHSGGSTHVDRCPSCGGQLL